jgi:hypothetical protein
VSSQGGPPLLHDFSDRFFFCHSPVKQHSLDDPLITWRSVAANEGLLHPDNLTQRGSGNLLILLTKQGGHVGWVSDCCCYHVAMLFRCRHIVIVVDLTHFLLYVLFTVAWLEPSVGEMEVDERRGYVLCRGSR